MTITSTFCHCNRGAAQRYVTICVRDRKSGTAPHFPPQLEETAHPQNAHRHVAFVSVESTSPPRQLRQHLRHCHVENLVENGNVNDLLNDALGKTLMRHELRGALLHLLLAETASPCAAVLVNVTRRDMFMKSGLDHFHQTTTGLGTPPSRLAPARLPHLKKGKTSHHAVSSTDRRTGSTPTFGASTAREKERCLSDNTSTTGTVADSTSGHLTMPVSSSETERRESNHVRDSSAFATRHPNARKVCSNIVCWVRGTLVEPQQSPSESSVSAHLMFCNSRVESIPSLNVMYTSCILSAAILLTSLKCVAPLTTDDPPVYVISSLNRPAHSNYT